ncbi:MAG: transglycosylase SLT domain-containing protein [Xanthobacteraceae bacterium]
MQGIAEQAASENGVPVSLVDRVIKRESGGNPRAVSRGNFGLMQIRLGTARAMGYRGSAAGLLDPGTNMTYAVRYLAGAYRAAGGNESRAVALYARGYGAAPRLQYASYDSGQPEKAAFGNAAYYDSFTRPYAVRRVRHYRRRAL